MTRAREICYDLEELIADCATNKVSVTKQAREDAKEHYSLMDQAQILDFLSMGDFKNQELDHDSTDELDKGNDAGTTFDAYTFRMGLKKYVYFAFYRRRNGFWIDRKSTRLNSSLHSFPTRRSSVLGREQVLS